MSIVDERYVTCASFLVTEDCNLRCAYCFEKDNKQNKYMTKEVVKKGLELICDGGIKNGTNNFHAMIFGGEPLLNPELIKYIFDYGLELSRKNNIEFTASIITNTTIMNDNIFWLLMEYKDKVKLSLQLSVDGIQEVHDKYRVTKNGKGSFHLIEKNIDRFKLIYKNNPNGLSIHGCLNRESLPHMFEGFKLFKEEWGIDNIWFMPVHEENWQEEDIDIYRKELTKIANYTLEKVEQENNIQEIKYYAPINKCLRPNIRANAPCSAGKSFITITSDGEIYPCHHFYFNDNEKTTLIGNVNDGIDDSKRRLFLDYSSKDMSCPSDCDHNHCYRCIGVNWVYNGSILSQVRGNYCKMAKVEKEVTDIVIKKLDDLEIDYKNNICSNNEINNQKDDTYYQEKYNEVFAKALELILLKVDNLEQQLSNKLE